jgi:CHAD domain-containing protein
MQTGTFASETVTKLLERLAYQVNHTLHAGNAEAIHDLRVAIRRFSQSLSLFKGAFVSKEVKKIRRSIGELQELTNDPRDCDVALQLLAKRKLPAGVPALQQAIRERRKTAMRQVIPALRRWGARKTSAKWRDALIPNGGSETPLADTARDRVPSLVKRMLKHGAKASSADELHRLRLDGKKLRYSLELLQPAYGGAAEKWVEQMSDVQSLIGKVTDCRAVRALIGKLDGATDVEKWLKKRQKKKTREFQEQWPAAEAALRAALVVIRRPARKPVGRSAGAPAKAVALRA